MAFPGKIPAYVPSARGLPPRAMSGLFPRRVGAPFTGNAVLRSVSGMLPTATALADGAWSPRLGVMAIGGGGGGHPICTSRDSINWVTRATTGASFSRMLWIDELRKFYGLGTQSQGWESYDGIVWSQTTACPANIWDVCYSNRYRRLVCVTTNTASLSDDGGKTWYSATTMPAGTWLSVCCADELGLLVATNNAVSTNRFAVSSDGGKNWSTVSGEAVSLWRISWAPKIGTFCAVGTGNTFISRDGKTWRKISVPLLTGQFSNQWIPALGMFAVTDFSAPYIAFSADGVTWKTVPTGAVANRYGLCFNPSSRVLLVTADTTRPTLVANL